jgi:hypothetical protein
MIKLIKTLLIFFIPVSPVVINAQDCHHSVKYCPHGHRDGYIFNMQSSSGAFIKGDTAEVSIIVYKGMEYKISLCSNSHPELNGNFQFKIVELITKGKWVETTTYTTELETDEWGEVTGGEKKIPHTTKKRVYEKEELVRFDNSENDNVQDYIFQSNKTRKLVVKVYIPDVPSEYEDFGGEAYACVGLLVEHQKGVKTGFGR